MLSFDVYYVDIDQKLQNLKILLVFSNFWVDFQIFKFSQFFLIYEKNILKKAQISWEWYQLVG